MSKIVLEMMNMNIDQERKLCESAETLLEKNQGNLFLAGFSHLEPLCAVRCKFGLDQKF